MGSPIPNSRRASLIVGRKYLLIRSASFNKMFLIVHYPFLSQKHLNSSIFLFFVILLYHTLSYFTTLHLTKCYSHFKEGDYMKPLKSKVSITLDEDVIQKIKILAEKDDRSFSQYINMVLKEQVARCEADNQSSSSDCH